MSRPSSLVEKTSVQMQLMALQQDRDNLRSAVAAADNERSKVEQELRDLQQEHRDLTKAGHEAQQKLGNFHAQRSLWQAEEGRLTNQLKEDRHRLEECSQEADECETEETKRKEAYCSEMKKLIEKHASLIRKLETCRLSSLLLPETVDALHQLWREKEASTSHLKGEGEMEDTVGANLVESMNLWRQATDTLSQAAAANENLLQQIEASRNQVLSRSSSMSREQLLGEERVWSGTSNATSFEDHALPHPHGEVPRNVQVFYDDGHDVEEDENSFIPQAQSTAFQHGGMINNQCNHSESNLYHPSIFPGPNDHHHLLHHQQQEEEQQQ